LLVSTVYGAGDQVSWYGLDWTTVYGNAYSLDTDGDSVNDELHILTEASGTPDPTGDVSNYRGSVYHQPLSPLPEPWYLVSFQEPVEDLSVQMLFSGAGGEYLWIEVDQTGYRFLARNTLGNEYAGDYPMPPEMWGLEFHTVSFGVREGSGYIDLWFDNWKQVTIRDPAFAGSGLLQSYVQLDALSTTSSQEAVFTFFELREGYSYSNTPPVITQVEEPGSLPEGPDPAEVGVRVFFQDAEGWDSFTASVDWGDGVVEEVDEASVHWTPDYLNGGGSGWLEARHTYLGDGLYPVSVVLIDEEGGTAETSFEVEVGEAPPLVDFSWFAQPTLNGYSVTLVPQVEPYPDQLDRHEWYLDGQATPFQVSSDDQQVSLEFNDQEPHTITLKSYDSDGSHGTAQKTVEPLVLEGEVRSVSPAQPLEGELVSIEVGIVGDAAPVEAVDWWIEGEYVGQGGTTLDWVFGDDGEYVFEAALHTPQGSTLVEGTIHVLDVPLSIQVLDPQPPITADLGGVLEITWVIREPGEDGPWGYRWMDETGDVLYDYGGDPSPVPDVPIVSKLYMSIAEDTQLTLRVWGEDDQAEETLSVVVDSEPRLSLSGPTQVSVGQTAEFTAEILNPGLTYIESLTWDMAGEPRTSSISSSTIVKESMVFQSPGTYHISATLTTTLGESTTQTLTITVEGLPPEETPRSLKEWVLEELAATREEVEETVDKPKSILKSLDQAINALQKSLNPKYWESDVLLDPKKGDQVFKAERKAVDKLEHAIKKWEKEGLGGTMVATWEEIINTLVDADKMLAEANLEDAWSQAGPDPDKKILKHLDKSQEFLDKADQEEDPAKAINHYRQSWKHSQKAKDLLNKSHRGKD